MAKSVANQSEAFESPVSPGQARAIMGRNFLCVAEVVQQFKLLRFSKKELAKVAMIPFPEKVLQALKDTHILFPGYPLSVLDIRAKARNLFCSPKHSGQGDKFWYGGASFAEEEKVGLRWYLIRADIIPGSADKTYHDQEALLSVNEGVPRACEMVYMVILYYLARGIRLLERVYARCQDITPDNCRVGAGFFSETLGLDIRPDLRKDDRYHHYAGGGVAASWKLL